MNEWERRGNERKKKNEIWPTPPINLGSWFAKPGTTENERFVPGQSLEGVGGESLLISI